LNILGGGMAGLCAAARARELGARPVVFEQGDRPGGSMALSSCVVWRYREWDEFRRQCPGGDAELQRLVFDRLDDALTWLRALGAPVVAEETRNPITAGMRFDPGGLTETLVRAAGDVRTRSTCDDPAILATGGFQGSRELVERFIQPAAPLPLRANRWSAGEGLQLGLGRGAALSAGMDEFYGRAMPDSSYGEQDFVPLAQLYAHRALVLDEEGAELRVDQGDWSETRLVQEIARRPGGACWYVLDDDGLADPDVSARVERARAVGGTVVAVDQLPFPVPASARIGVRVRASITHTIGGLRVDPDARVLREDGVPVDGLFAAGADVGGISTGGYASGLAAALVLGLTAAESAVA
jgi:succinate dehydrogenase/fumarate reductase flavoprotein subunit